MDDWFTSLAERPDPGKRELYEFLDHLRGFLNAVLERDDFAFLWDDDRDLRELALNTYHENVVPAIKRLQDALDDIDVEKLIDHGLVGRAMRFKLRVIGTVSRGWQRARQQLRIRGWFGRMVTAIDVPLDSLVAAAGVGGIVKEFKDALAALAMEER